LPCCGYGSQNVKVDGALGIRPIELDKDPERIMVQRIGPELDKYKIRFYFTNIQPVGTMPQVTKMAINDDDIVVKSLLVDGSLTLPILENQIHSIDIFFDYSKFDHQNGMPKSGKYFIDIEINFDPQDVWED